MLRGGEGESRRLSCGEVGSLLPEFADEVLEDVLRRQIEEHVGGCQACRRLLEEEYAEKRLLERVLGARRLSSEGMRRLKRGVLEELPRKVEHIYITRPGHVRVGPIEFRLSFWVPLAAAAAAFLVAFMLRPVTVARIADLAGGVELRRAGGAEWTRAGTNSGLRAGDALRTEAFSARLALRDGTSLEVEPFSEIAVGSARPGVRQVVELKEGKLVAEVTRASSRFRVETDYGEVSVLGTRFRTALRRMGVQQISALDLSVEKGTVEVSNSTGARLVAAGERVLVGAKTDPSLIGTAEAEDLAGKAYKDILNSLPSSGENTQLVRQAISNLADMVACYPNTRWADDALWVLSFLHPTYLLSSERMPNISNSVQLCSEWVSRYGQSARLEEWTAWNFPSLLRGEAVASRSVMVSSRGELTDLMAIHKADIHLRYGRSLAAAGEMSKALEAYGEGLNVLQTRPQGAGWLARLREEVEDDLRDGHARLRMQLEQSPPVEDSDPLYREPTGESVQAAREEARERAATQAPRPQSRPRTRVK